MSFLSTVFHGIGVAVKAVTSTAATAVVTSLQIAVPIITLVNPAAGAIANKVATAIVGVEAMITTEKQGVLKRQTVSQIALAELPQLEAVIAQFGPNVKIPPEELGAFIDASVAEYNALDKLMKAIEAANAAPKV